MTSVVFVAGPAGTGKSTLADAIAETLGGVHLDFDLVSAGVVAEARTAHPDCSEAEVLSLVKDQRYAALREALVDHRSRRPDTPVVVSAPFTRHTASAVAWAPWESLAPGSLLVWLRVDEAERERRIAARGATRDHGAARADAAIPGVAHLAVDSSAPPAELVGQVLRALNSD